VKNDPGSSGLVNLSFVLMNHPASFFHAMTPPSVFFLAWELARWAIEAKMNTRSILESWISQNLCTLWASHLRICQVNILGGWNITPFFFFFTNETENHFFS
jgi:uncharacterized protein (DUF2062 family)